MRNFRLLIEYLLSIDLSEIFLGEKGTPMNPMNPHELLYGGALAHLGKDASPGDLAPDELGCMESVDAIHKGIFGDHLCKNFLSTYWGYKALDERDDFEEIPETQAREGDIVISPTMGNVTGHIGILGKGDIIMSNNSFPGIGGQRGIFEENYTRGSWKRYFVGRRGLKMKFFRKIKLSTATPGYGGTAPLRG